MTLNKLKKENVIHSFQMNDKDSGSSPVQIALITERINLLTDHFKTHKKDHHSRVGLLRLVSKRRKLLDYLKKRDSNKYKEVIEKLNLRK